MTDNRTTALPPVLLDLEDLLEINAERPNRGALVQQPSLKFLAFDASAGAGIATAQTSRQLRDLASAQRNRYRTA